MVEALEKVGLEVASILDYVLLWYLRILQMLDSVSRSTFSWGIVVLNHTLNECSMVPTNGAGGSE